MSISAGLKKQFGVFFLLALLYFGNQFLGNDESTPDPDATRPNTTVGSSDTAARSGHSGDDTDLIVQSYEAQRSDVWVQASGVVLRVLADDNNGSRHQRFLVELRGGHTVLIAHNIDLAPKVPLVKGDGVEFRGEYEWNDRGGVVHWTHHDPRGRKQGGWISHQRQKYE